MIITQTAGGVVQNHKKEVLVVSQRNNVWSLPKGHIDPGENKLEAAIREIYEESGIKEENLVMIKELGSYDRYKISKIGNDDKSELKTIHLFLFKSSQLELAPIDPENPEAIWVKKEEVSKLLTHQKDKDFFDSLSELI